MEPEKGVMGTSGLQLQSEYGWPSGTYDRQLLWRQSCETEPLTCGVGAKLVATVRIELNFWSPRWYQRIGCWC